MRAGAGSEVSNTSGEGEVFVGAGVVEFEVLEVV